MYKGKNNTKKNNTNRKNIKRKTKKLKGGAQSITTRNNNNIKTQSKSIISLKNKKELSGPISMYYMENKTLNKRIYLFGASHVDKSNSCAPSDISIKITSLLNQIFYNTEIPIDFFLETLYYDYYTQYKENNRLNDFLGQVIFKMDKNAYLDDLRFFRYYGCFGKEIKDTEECIKRYPNIRFHYTDLRLDNLSLIPKLLFSENYDNYIKERNTGNKAENKEKLKIIKEQLDLMNIYVDNFTNIVSSNFQNILKDFNKIPDTPLYKNIKEGIIEYWKKYVEDSYTYAKQLIEYLDKENDYIEILSNIKPNTEIYTPIEQDSIKKLFNNFKKKQIILVNINFTFDNIIEIYTLVRLFKKMEEKKGRKHLSDYANNCIIYMGNDHIINIKNFLEKNGFKTKKFTNKKLRCVDIENVLSSGNLFN